MLSRNNAMVRNKRLIVDCITVLILSLLVGCNGKDSNLEIVLKNDDLTLVVTENIGPPHQFKVYDIAIDSQQNKWFATSNGVLKLEDNGTLETSDDVWTTYEHFWQDYDDDKIEFSVIEFDEKGNIVVGSGSAGVVCYYDGNDWDYIITGSSWSEDVISNVISGKDGLLWLNLENGIIKCESTFDYCVRYDNTDNNLLLNSIVTAIEVDKSDNLWVGLSSEENSQNNSLCKINSSFDVWSCFSELDNLSCGIINVIYVDQSGDIWTGHDRCYLSSETASYSRNLKYHKNNYNPSFYPIDIQYSDGPYVSRFIEDGEVFEKIGPLLYGFETNLEDENMYNDNIELDDFIIIDNDKIIYLYPFKEVISLLFSNDTLWIGFSHFTSDVIEFASVGRNIDDIVYNCEDKNFSWLDPGGLLTIDINTLNQDYYYQIGECIDIDTLKLDEEGNLWIGTGSNNKPIYIIDEGGVLHSLP